MNETVIKRASVFALILGGFIGLLSVIPSLVGLTLFIFLPFLASSAVILFMKKNDKHLGIINNEQSAILGGIIGFLAGIGFFVTFCPMVCILHLIFKTYYPYAIPDMIQSALWLFIITVVMVAGIFALTNSAAAMGLYWILNKIEKKPENFDAPLDIKIDD